MLWKPARPSGPIVTLLVNPVRIVALNKSGAADAAPTRRLDPYAFCQHSSPGKGWEERTMTDSNDLVEFPYIGQGARSQALGDRSSLSDFVCDLNDANPVRMSRSAYTKSVVG